MLTARNINSVFILLAIALACTDAFASVPWWTYTLLIVLYSLIHAYGSTVLSAQFFVSVRSHGQASSNAVALTFDDGPIAESSERVLSVLEEKKIKAAFFTIGHRAITHPELIKRMDGNGHLVCNHSYWHGKFFDLQSATVIAKELEDTDAIIEKIIGKRPAFFRPPYGVTNPMVASALKQTGHVVVGWTIRSFDTVIKDPQKLFDKVTGNIQAGDVVLFHDYSESMIQILPRLIDHINDLGLKIVRLDELLKEKPYAD